MKNKEEYELYKNTYNFRFLFLGKSPKGVLISLFGISLPTLNTIVALIYGLRAIPPILQFFSAPSKPIQLYLIVNICCLITSIFQLISIKTKLYKYTRSTYLVHGVHFIGKVLSSILLLTNKLNTAKTISALIGMGLGLMVGSTINFISVYIVYSYMVYCYNLEMKSKNK